MGPETLVKLLILGRDLSQLPPPAKEKLSKKGLNPTLGLVTRFYQENQGWADGVLHHVDLLQEEGKLLIQHQSGLLPSPRPLSLPRIDQEQSFPSYVQEEATKILEQQKRDIPLKKQLYTTMLYGGTLTAGTKLPGGGVVKETQSFEGKRWLGDGQEEEVKKVCALFEENQKSPETLLEKLFEEKVVLDYLRSNQTAYTDLKTLKEEERALLIQAIQREFFETRTLQDFLKREPEILQKVEDGLREVKEDPEKFLEYPPFAHHLQNRYFFSNVMNDEARLNDLIQASPFLVKQTLLLFALEGGQTKEALELLKRLQQNLPTLSSESEKLQHINAGLQEVFQVDLDQFLQNMLTPSQKQELAIRFSKPTESDLNDPALKEAWGKLSSHSAWHDTLEDGLNNKWYTGVETALFGLGLGSSLTGIGAVVGGPMVNISLAMGFVSSLATTIDSYFDNKRLERFQDLGFVHSMFDQQTVQRIQEDVAGGYLWGGIGMAVTAGAPLVKRGFKLLR